MSAPRGDVCSWGGVSAVGGVCSGGCLLPGGCLHPGGVSAPEGVSASGGGLVSQHALRQTPPGQTATAADGTHPTGMHSCL